MNFSETTENYLNELLVNNCETPFLQDVRKQAESNGIPILSAKVSNLLSVICAISAPVRILEIGTAVGYSASIMLNACETGNVTTIEMSEAVIAIAKSNFEAQGFADRVNIIQGDAREIIPQMQGQYDFIFLDGPKSQYLTFLPYLTDMLVIGGVLFCDNVLFRGFIAGEREIEKSKATIIRKLREFLAKLSSDKTYSTTVLSIGDGVSISVKNK